MTTVKLKQLFKSACSLRRGYQTCVLPSLIPFQNHQFYTLDLISISAVWFKLSFVCSYHEILVVLFFFAFLHFYCRALLYVEVFNMIGYIITIFNSDPPGSSSFPHYFPFRFGWDLSPFQFFAAFGLILMLRCKLFHTPSFPTI